MVEMRRATKWVVALVLGLCVALTPEAAQAGFVAGGSTQPNNAGAKGYVGVQVYGGGGGAADPYGIGISSAALIAAGFTGAATDGFLYLYRTTNIGTDIAQNTVQSNPALNHGAGNLAGLTFAGAAPLVATPPGDNFAVFTAEGAAAAIVAGGTSPAMVVQGATSIAATFSPNLVAGSSTLWGYTSNVAPVLVHTSIQDSGNSATGLTLGTPEPASIVMLGLGAAGMCGYGWKRRKVTA